MTLKELSQLYYLNREIKRDEERLNELKMTQLKVTPNYAGMPKAKGKINDTMAQNVAYIVDLEQMLRLNIEKRYYEEKRIMNFICSIDDCFLRLIFKLRFIDCKKWNTIALEVGGGNTDATVKMACFRYLQKTKIGYKSYTPVGYNT